MIYSGQYGSSAYGGFFGTVGRRIVAGARSFLFTILGRTTLVSRHGDGTVLKSK